MNRLFPTLALTVFLALSSSLLVSWYLLEYPLFTANTAELEVSLEQVADDLRQQLSGHPESQWDSIIVQTPHDRNFDINWFSLEDNGLPIEDQALLFSTQRLISHEADETPVMEMLFPEQRMVLVIEPSAGYRPMLNTLVSVLAVLAICFIAALLALRPLARRIRQLQLLANEYGQGNWLVKNSDKRKDHIGELGESMQNMASQIHQLIENNNSLVIDQRELMQAVAHEFRAPMARMRFALEMKEDSTVDAAASAEISQALDELNEMVSEVLQYARLQIAAPDLTMNAVILNQLIQECVVKCRQQFPESVFETDLPHPVLINADPAHLQRAFINLFSNAAKYGHNKIQISIEESADRVSVHIDDDGFGIPDRDKQRALKPFVRLDSSRSRKLGGTGLGLAIAHGVAIKHNGTLKITDSKLGGARLTITLPLTDN